MNMLCCIRIGQFLIKNYPKYILFQTTYSLRHKLIATYFNGKNVRENSKTK